MAKRPKKRPKRTKKIPPMRQRPIYVQYVAYRRCRRNPSFDRFIDLPELDKRWLIERLERRHNQRVKQP